MTLGACATLPSGQDSLDAIAGDYVLLQLTIGEKEAGYIDAYYGDSAVMERAKTEAPTQTLPQLAQRVAALESRTAPFIEDGAAETSMDERLYIASISPNARKLAHAVRSHWGVENRLHWCLDVCLNDDQARARVKNSAQNLAAVRRMVLNILRLDKSRKGGIKTRRLVASTSDSYREQLLGMVAI